MPHWSRCDICQQNFEWSENKFVKRPCPDPLGVGCKEQLSSGKISTYDDNDYTDPLPEEKSDDDRSVVVNNSSPRAVPQSTEEMVASYGNLHHTTKGGTTSGTNHMRHWEQGKHQAYREHLAAEKKKGNKKAGKIGGGSKNRI
jgi:hypothetical protein